ncbi:MAG: hypothetical protein GF398_09265 [Chitinivibrionales bacterium]|nr:hypothetical protein [Chitinivibrionales bacterium]
MKENNYNIAGYFLLLIRKKKLIIGNFIFICAIALIYALYFVEIQFSSSIVFLPPVNELPSLNMLSNFSLGSLSKQDIMPEHVLSIFESKDVKKDIIEKFDLVRKYELANSPNKLEFAIKELNKNLSFNVTEKGNLGYSTPVSYSISAFHSSPDTAYEIVWHCFNLIDSTIKHISSKRGRNNRLFIEQQLAENKVKLNELHKKLNKFQKKHKAFDVSKQLKLTMESYGELKSKILANEVTIQMLRSHYVNHFSLNKLEKENKILKRKLEEFETHENADILVSLEQSAILSKKLSDYYRDVEVQNKLILLLSQQLEEAKLKEANNISTLSIIQTPYIAEYKARPKRSVIVLSIASAYMMFVCLAMLSYQFYKVYLSKLDGFNEFISAVKKI